MKFTQNVITIAAAPSRHCASHSEAATAVAAALWAALLILTIPAFAQNAESIADREVQRRQSAIPAGEAALARGKSAIRSKNYTVAYQEFKTAISYLPDSVVSGKSHDEAADGICKSGTVLAEAHISRGDSAGAEATLSEILRYDPN